MDGYQSYDMYMMYPSVSTFDLCFVCNKDFSKCGWVLLDDAICANIFADWSWEFRQKMNQQKQEIRSQFNVDSMNEIFIKNMSILLDKQDIYSNTISDDDAYDAYDVKEYIGTEKLKNILNDVWIKSKYYKSEDGSMNFMNNYDKKIIF
eukprot:416177_1